MLVRSGAREAGSGDAGTHFLMYETMPSVFLDPAYSPASPFRKTFSVLRRNASAEFLAPPVPRAGTYG